jgi:drug/metabolite transporter (DMT)-like permease
MPDTAASRRLGILYTAAATLAWSTGGAFARFTTTDLATTNLWRNFFAFVGISLVLLVFQGRAGLAGFRQMGKPGLLTACLGGTAAFVTVPALQLTSVAHVVVIYATTPFLAGAIAWAFYGQRPSRIDVVASLAAILGAAIMIGLSREGGLAGDILSLILAGTMSGVMVLFRQNPTVPSLPTAVTAFGLTVTASLIWTQSLAVPLAALPLLAAYGLVNSALGTAFFLLGSRLLRPVETAIIGALETPLAPLWVWIIFSETPGAATVIGGGIVMVAVVWHVLQSAKADHATAATPQAPL